MRHTANFYLLVSCFLVMVQGLKSEHPSQLRERRIENGRSTSCDLCSDDRVRKVEQIRVVPKERSHEQIVDRELKTISEGRLHTIRDEAISRSQRGSDERTRIVLRPVETSKQVLQRDRETYSLRRDGAINERQRRSADLNRRDTTNERRIEHRSEGRRDRNIVRRTKDGPRHNEIGFEQTRRNQDIRDQRTFDNNLDKTRDINAKRVVSFQRGESLIRTDSRSIDKEQPRFQRQRMLSSRLTNAERIEKRTLDDRKIVADDRQRRVEERTEHGRNIARRDIRTARLQETRSRRNAIIPARDGVTDRNEVRQNSQIRNLDITRKVSINHTRAPKKNEQRYLRRSSDNDVRDERLSKVQRRDSSERRERLASQDDGRLSSKRGNFGRIIREPSERLSDIRRVVYSYSDRYQRTTMGNTLISRRDNSREERRESPPRLSDNRRDVSLSRLYRGERQNNEESREKRRQKETYAADRRREHFRDNSLYYRIDGQALDNRHGPARINSVSYPNRAIVGDKGKQMRRVRQVSLNETINVLDMYNTNKRNDLRLNWIAEKNLDVDLKVQLRKSRIGSRIEAGVGSRDYRVHRDVRLYEENDKTRKLRNVRFTHDRLSSARRLEIPSFTLKSRCLNRNRFDADNRRRNGNMALNDGRTSGIKDLDDERRRITNRDVPVRDMFTKGREDLINSESLSKIAEPITQWSTQFISVDGWSVTRAIVVGVVGIMGRSLWQKQV